MPSHIRSFSSLLRRFRRNRGGSAVVEFALVAPMFFALLFAIIETALVFFASQVLETVTKDSARMILTGQAQNQALTAAQFKPPSFAASLRIVRLRERNFHRRAELYPVQQCQRRQPDPCQQELHPNPNNYNPGGPGDIVVVRLFYQMADFGHQVRL